MIESGRSQSSGYPNTQSDEGDSPSPRKVGRFSKPPNSHSPAPAPSTSPPHLPKSGLLTGAPTPTQLQAQKPNSLRLRGFQCKLTKKDMVQLAGQLMTHAGIAPDSILEFHCSGIASSCVVEFVSESHFRKALDLSKSVQWKWDDPVTSVRHSLFFSIEESSESRAVGAALHILWDSALQHLIPSCLLGTALQTNKI